MAEGKIKVFIKRPDEKYGHVAHISPSLENLQNIVGGYTEAVCIRKVEKDGKEYEVVILCDEEGKLKHKMPNIALVRDIICGDIIVLGSDGEDFCDLPITFQEWKDMRYWA